MSFSLFNVIALCVFASTFHTAKFFKISLSAELVICEYGAFSRVTVFFASALDNRRNTFIACGVSCGVNNLPHKPLSMSCRSQTFSNVRKNVITSESTIGNSDFKWAHYCARRLLASCHYCVSFPSYRSMSHFRRIVSLRSLSSWIWSSISLEFLLPTVYDNGLSRAGLSPPAPSVM